MKPNGMAAAVVLGMGLGTVLAAGPAAGEGSGRPRAEVTMADGTTFVGVLVEASEGNLCVEREGVRANYELAKIRGIRFVGTGEAATEGKQGRGIRIGLVAIERPKSVEAAKKRLDRIGANYEVIAPDVPAETLKRFDVVYFPEGWAEMGGLGALAPAYKAFCRQGGGGLLFAQPCSADHRTSEALELLPHPVRISGRGPMDGGSERVYTPGTPHVLMQGVSKEDLPWAGNIINGYDPGWTVLARVKGGQNWPTILTAQAGQGRILLHVNRDDYGHLHHLQDRFVVRVIRWLARRPDAEVAGDEPLGAVRVSEWVAALRQDYERLSAAETPAVRQALGRAEQLLRNDAHKAATWTSYGEAIRLVRANRSKAAIPMLLNLLADDRLQHDNYRDSIYKSLVLLTGRALVGDSTEAIATGWWQKGKDTMTVDVGKMAPEEVQTAAREVLAMSAWETGERVGRSHAGRQEKTITPYQMRAFLSRGPEYPRWYPEDLHEAMLPAFLAAADDPAGRWFAVDPLAAMRRAGKAAGLTQVAADASAPAGRRVVAAVAILKAGEQTPAAALMQTLKGPLDVELKMAAVGTLGQSQDPAAAETVVAFLQDAQPAVREMAATAPCIRRCEVAVPLLAAALKKECRHDAGSDPLVAALGAIGTREAVTALMELIDKTLQTCPDDPILEELVRAAEAATKQRFRRPAKNRDADSQEAARQALQWWRSQ